MKLKNLLFCLLAITIINCSDDDTMDIDNYKGPAEDVTDHDALAAISGTEDRTYENPTGQSENRATYSAYTVDYNNYVNDSHPNGHIIIKAIFVGETTYEIQQADGEYIEAIHGSLYAGGYNVDVYLQGDSVEDMLFKQHFRNCEAIIVAAELEGTTTPSKEAVKDAGRRMEGRQYGVSK